MLDGILDDGAELAVLLLLEADIARVDAVFVERLGAGRMVGEQLVADIVEVAAARDMPANLEQEFLDVGHGGPRLLATDGDAPDLGTGGRERRALLLLPAANAGVCSGRRLDHDRRAAADL